MTGPIIECVPNFSEGRDASKVEAIVRAAASVQGVAILGRESDHDHNRSVLTFAGPPEAVAEGAVRAIGAAVDLIDLDQHSGVHPRIGAADVVPFVPVRGISIDDCAALAERSAHEVWRRFRVPVYLYEAAARRPERVALENIRRGGLPFLRAHLEERPPDVGDKLHPTAGATVMGARRFLIAFNINLANADLRVAQAIARRIRTSSGGFPAVKALGLWIDSRNLAQVSMNLTDFETTGIRIVYNAVEAAAAEAGANIDGVEIIGFVPQKAVHDLPFPMPAGRILEDHLEPI